MTAPPLTVSATPAPRRPRAVARDEIIRTGGIAACAVSVVELLFAVSPLDGIVGFFALSYLSFVLAYSADAWRQYGPVAGRDRIATVAVSTAGIGAVVPLLLIVTYALGKGLGGLSANFFTQTMDSVGPLDPASVGGARHAVIGTLEQVVLAAVLATPLGLLTAVHLTESDGRLSRFTRLLVDAMSGIPSIVAGLFLYTMWVVRFDRGFSGVSAAMALAVLMLPTVARTAEEVLRLVPHGLRESALALGAPVWRVVLSVIIPTARSGIITATVLGIGRIAGETAPLLMTAFGSDSVNTNPFSGPQSALPLFAFQRVRNAVPTQIARGWAAALVLIVLVLVLFTVARVLGARSRKV